MNMTVIFVESDSTISQLRIQLMDVNERLRNATLYEYGIVVFTSLYIFGIPKHYALTGFQQASSMKCHHRRHVQLIVLI
jgi:hypothetical protein